MINTKAVRQRGFIPILIIIIVSFLAASGAAAVAVSEGVDLPKVASNLVSNFIQPTFNNVASFVTSEVSTISQNQAFVPAPLPTETTHTITPPSPTPKASPTPAPTPLPTTYVPVIKCLGADGLYSYVTQEVCDSVKNFWDEHPPAPVTGGGDPLPEATTVPIDTPTPAPVSTSSAALSPGTVVDDAAVGTEIWITPENILSSNNVYSHVVTSNETEGGLPKDYMVNVVKTDGTFGSTNKATRTTISTVESFISYGGASDLWGETWTPADINNSNFGVGYAVIGDSLTPNIASHYIKATNFGFNIPTSATIDGVLVQVEVKRTGLAPTRAASVDNVRITVYYTY